jgi:hypothetical protein
MAWYVNDLVGFCSRSHSERLCKRLDKLAESSSGDPSATSTGTSAAEAAVRAYAEQQDKKWNELTTANFVPRTQQRCASTCVHFYS